MISKKSIVAWVFSAIVSVGMFAVPGRALAEDWGHGHGWHHSDDGGGWHGWDNHHRDDQCARPGYRPQAYGYRRPYAQGWNMPAYNYGQQGYGYNYNQPAYGYNYNQPAYGYNNYRPGYGLPADGQGMIDRRHPGLMWTCDSGGHHCHWAPRFGYGANSRTGLNPFAYGGLNNGYNGGRYYGNNYANGYYGNSGMGSLLGPLFGQRP